MTVCIDEFLAERTLGGIDVLLPYIKEYVKTFMGHSITTGQWKDHLYLFFGNQEDKIKALDTIDWDVSVSCVLERVYEDTHHVGLVLWRRDQVTNRVGV